MNVLIIDSYVYVHDKLLNMIGSFRVVV
uniref:Uncharacterized protein n=1 Tax=Nelumbo nucifera TaxID=4432 RepID=A0A822Z5B4_NELNU|nr:TPA_asm: hypothetical protein HUJ06_013203 [Nelumbo nucifera]